MSSMKGTTLLTVLNRMNLWKHFTLDTSGSKTILRLGIPEGLLRPGLSSKSRIKNGLLHIEQPALKKMEKTHNVFANTIWETIETKRRPVSPGEFDANKLNTIRSSSKKALDQLLIQFVKSKKAKLTLQENHSLKGLVGVQGRLQVPSQLVVTNQKSDLVVFERTFFAPSFKESKQSVLDSLSEDFFGSIKDLTFASEKHKSISLKQQMNQFCPNLPNDPSWLKSAFLKMSHNPSLNLRFDCSVDGNEITYIIKAPLSLMRDNTAYTVEDVDGIDFAIFKQSGIRRKKTESLHMTLNQFFISLKPDLLPSASFLKEPSPLAKEENELAAQHKVQISPSDIGLWTAYEKNRQALQEPPIYTESLKKRDVFASASLRLEFPELFVKGQAIPPQVFSTYTIAESAKNARKIGWRQLGLLIFRTYGDFGLSLGETLRRVSKFSIDDEILVDPSIISTWKDIIERSRERLNTFARQSVFRTKRHEDVQSELPKVKARPDDAPDISLPIRELYDEVVNCIQQYQVTIVSAGTGSGKSTQIPQFILRHYCDVNRHLNFFPNIIVTQPRRVAATSLAKRVAFERGETLGKRSSVGYSVRFDSKPPTARQKLLFCTSGILTKRLMADPLLSGVTHLIIDEVHGRETETDLILQCARDLLVQRPDLRVILMSATINANPFVHYFSRQGLSVAPVIHLPRNTFPVQEYCLDDFLPLIGNLPKSRELSRFLSSIRGVKRQQLFVEDNLEPNFEILSATLAYVSRVKPPGAIICFLPGWKDLVNLRDRIQNSWFDPSRHQLHLAHSQVPHDEMDRLFEPSTKRKIVLTTNIAESSITLPDAVYVVDSGFQKVSDFSAKHKIKSLRMAWVSKSNLQQRRGRVGRTQPGEYYLALPSAMVDFLPQFVPPELMRQPLEEVCLLVKNLKPDSSIEQSLSNLLDPPYRSQIYSAISQLKDLGCLDSNEDMTKLGHILSKLPINPVYGKMLLFSSLFGVNESILHLAAAEDRIRFFPHDPMTEYEARLHSDHLRVLAVLKEVQQTRMRISDNPRLMMNVQSIRSVVNDLRKTLISEKALPEGTNRKLSEEDFALVRFILALSLYPSYAIYSSKNNLKMGKSQFILGKSSSFSHPDFNSLNGFDENNKPKIVAILDDIVDIGVRVVTRMTGIDPVMLLLISPNVQFNDDNCLATVDSRFSLLMDTHTYSQTKLLREGLNLYLEHGLQKILTGRVDNLMSDEFSQHIVPGITKLLHNHIPITRDVRQFEQKMQGDLDNINPDEEQSGNFTGLISRYLTQEPFKPVEEISEEEKQAALAAQQAEDGNPSIHTDSSTANNARTDGDLNDDDEIQRIVAMALKMAPKTPRKSR